jgi:NSS family neurotransmitter:Na+ symporter
MLLDVNIWLAAFGQIIFSLSCGEALALTYASYLPKNSKLIDNVLLVVASNSAFEICTAFGVFSILGFMSFTSGTPITELISEGTSLIFVVFPTIFNIMGPMGRILAPLLFLAILFVGVTSALGLFEPMLSSTYDKFGWSRKKTTTILCIVGCFFSLILTTGISSYLVGIIDSFVNKFGVLFLIPIQAIIFGWIYGLDNIIPVLNENSTIKVGKIWKIVIKYIAPVVLFGLWFVGIFDLFTDAKIFEVVIDVIIMISVLVISFIFTNKKSTNQ